MRWTALFDDLEARASGLDEAARAVDVADRTRAEAAEIRLVDRLRTTQAPVRVQLRGGTSVRGAPQHVGSDWLLLIDESGDETIVFAAALHAVSGLGRFAQPAPGDVASRLSVRSALRGMARDRATVRIALVDGSTVIGTIDRVGADFLDVAVHVGDGVRRQTGVSEVSVISVSALAAIRRQS
ncbi:MAG TPA: hypothetical protein VJ831_13455 [Jatrophihabitantaceae bacterium]|nr:hypothetical protein [Jatrophihabitantaceae bacterium]